MAVGPDAAAAQGMRVVKVAEVTFTSHRPDRRI